jgi:ABC-type transporter Mla subunit MlaD
MRGRRDASIAANPILIGAATILVTVVGVFLAYNANNGLPFVPTYDVKVLVPDAAELVKGNDVRIGGKRVGAVATIKAIKTANGRFVSQLDLKLEKTVEPLRADTIATVRPRSTLGLKYLELKPGAHGRALPNGGTLPVTQAGRIVELDDVLNAFDAGTRAGIQDLVDRASNGVAGRGADLNDALAGLHPVLGNLGPVMTNLSDPRTALTGAIAGLNEAAGAAAPVSAQLGSLIDGAATTLGSLDAASKGLGGTLDRAPALMTQATSDLRAMSPVLADAARLANGLRPGADLLPAASRNLANVAQTGAPVLRRATRLGPDLEDLLKSLGALAKDPSTSVSVRKLTQVVASLGPTLRFVNPFQTQCNYLGLWTRNASSTISEGDENGTWFRFIPVLQTDEFLQRATPAPQLHATPYGNANADECETGNEPYLPGQHIGHPDGLQPNHTQLTAPPAGTPEGPR